LTASLNQKLVNYTLGIKIDNITIQSISPPSAIAAMFDQAAKTYKSGEGYITSANDYRASAIKSAQEHANTLIEQAKLQQQQAVLDANILIAEFLALLPQYQVQPNLTKSYLNWYLRYIKHASLNINFLPQLPIKTNTLSLEPSSNRPQDRPMDRPSYGDKL
jgi:regulator of protease activity HflC (stomatin/prohibitin superfamily)